MKQYKVWIIGREEETSQKFYAKTHREARQTYAKRNRYTSEVSTIDLDSIKC